MPNPAAVAYEAYCKSLISGEPLPPWSELRPEIQKAWMAAAQAVIALRLPIVLNDVHDMGKYPDYSPSNMRPGVSD